MKPLRTNSDGPIAKSTVLHRLLMLIAARIASTFDNQPTMRAAPYQEEKNYEIGDNRIAADRAAPK